MVAHVTPETAARVAGNTDPQRPRVKETFVAGGFAAAVAALWNQVAFPEPSALHAPEWALTAAVAGIAGAVGPVLRRLARPSAGRRVEMLAREVKALAEEVEKLAGRLPPPKSSKT